MSEPTSEARRARSSPARLVGLTGIVGLCAFVSFAYRLGDEPHFVDESAYYAQSGYADLFLTNRDHPAWLDYAGFDLPPLPKYLIGTSLAAFGYPRPNPRLAWDWYRDTSRRFETRESLVAARWPSVFLGAIGCMAIFVLGTVGLDLRVGLLASLFLALNPLYRLHARRAMSDVPAEAFMLVSLALGLWAWRRFADRGGDLRASLGYLGAGASLGLSVLSKLNGAIAGIVLGVWGLLALLVPGITRRASIEIVGSTLLAGVLSFLLFVALNPFLTARPQSPFDPRLSEVAQASFWERVAMVKDHRVEASRSGQVSFPDDALIGLRQKITAVAVQGFGRFGLFGPGRADSRIRLDPRQDRGAWVWGPLVALGLSLSISAGRRQRRLGVAPTAWNIALQSCVALVVVTLFIPLAWDRYYLSIQPGSCLLASVALVEGWDLIRKAFRR